MTSPRGTSRMVHRIQLGSHARFLMLERARMAAPTPRQRLDELFARLDSFFTSAMRQHGQAITCHAGCDDCCQRRFSVTSIEAAVIGDAIARLSDDERQAL